MNKAQEMLDNIKDMKRKGNNNLYEKSEGSIAGTLIGAGIGCYIGYSKGYSLLFSAVVGGLIGGVATYYLVRA